MPRKAMRLTDSAVKAAKPKDKPYKLTDEQGLYLEVMPDGSRQWWFEYQFGSQENCLALGSYSKITLKEARNRRNQVCQLLSEGKNPKAEQIKVLLHAATPRSRVKACTDWLEKNARRFIALGDEQDVSNMRQNATSITERLETDGFKASDKTMLGLKQLEIDTLFLAIAAEVTKRQITAKKNQRTRESPPWHQQALQLSQEGLATNIISKRLGKSESQVRKVIRAKKNAHL